MTAEKASILLNTEVIAINQDPLGIPGDMLANTSNAMVWSKPLHDGGFGVVLFNNDNFMNQMK